MKQSRCSLPLFSSFTISATASLNPSTIQRCVGFHLCFSFSVCVKVSVFAQTCLRPLIFIFSISFPFYFFIKWYSKIFHSWADIALLNKMTVLKTLCSFHCFSLHLEQDPSLYKNWGPEWSPTHPNTLISHLSSSRSHHFRHANTLSVPQMYWLLSC